MKKDLKNKIRFLYELVRNDLKARYSGSAFGMVWAYIQPLMTVVVFWYVFQIGFRNPPVDNIPFILWFVAGYIPWIFFNDGVISSANVFYEYSFLVKKMKFNIEILPVVKVLSSACIHVFFIIFIVVLYSIYGYNFSIAWLSMIYYSFCVFVVLLGIAYLVSAISVFIKDNIQLINIVLQIGFWLTPVFWSETSINENTLKILKLNPLYYVVTGYRNCLIENQHFWQRPFLETLYFWCFAFISFMLGTLIYKKLRTHFSDLL